MKHRKVDGGKPALPSSASGASGEGKPKAPAPPAKAAAAASAPSAPAGRSCWSILCALIFYGALLGFAVVAWWLYPPLKKAYLNKRAPDHPSENMFSLGKVGGFVCGGGAPRRARENTPLTTHPPRPPPSPPSRPAPPLPFPARSTGRFPSITEAPSLFLSVVVPAYNEEERMRKGLDEMVEYLAAKTAENEKYTWEIIIVNDGSKDGTKDIALNEYVSVYGAERVRLLQAHVNGGKGAAVRKGVMRARGKWVLMADADGATRFGDIAALHAAAREAAGRGIFAFALGSRAHMHKAAGGPKRSPLRRFLMWGFHSAIQLMLGGTPIEDTQCGFKLFTRAAARTLFTDLHIERWAFDVELVYIAAQKRIPMAEVPVVWQEIAGSKLDPATATIQMLRDIIVIRLAYMTGLWKL
jgi:dolichyl-phosphate beta-glucosyltransferase